MLPARAQENQPTVQVVTGVTTLFDVWCAPDGVCLGVGAVDTGAGSTTGLVVVLRAAGPSGPVRLVPGTLDLHGIDCPPNGSCFAVGRSVSGGTVAGVVVKVSRDGTPGPAVTVPGMTEIYGAADLGCPTAATCLVIGPRYSPTYPYPITYHFSVVTNGRPAPVQRLPRGIRGALGIDCPTETRCLVGGYNGFAVLTNVNGAWGGVLHEFSSPTGSPDGDVSCASSTTCYSIARGFVYTGGTGYYAVPAMIPVTADGVAGPVQLLSDRQGSSHDISCVFGRTCTVVGLLHSAGAISIDVFRGTSMAPKVWPDVISFSGVSCVAAATCGLVGRGPHGGVVFAWHGPVPA